MVRFWSKTQSTIAQSSAESELFGSVRGGVEALGAMTLMKDMGRDTTATLVLDASVALGILQRQGVGRIRHLDVGALWLQETEAQKKVKWEKIKGENNPADLGTKYLGEAVILRHLAKLESYFMDGRAGAAVKLLSVEQLLPKDWSDTNKAVHDKKDWEEDSEGWVSKTFKSARALRTPEPESGIWEKAVLYEAVDTATNEIISSLDVTNVAISDSRLHVIFSRPRDMKVRLKIEPDEPVEPDSPVGGGAGGSFDMDLSESSSPSTECLLQRVLAQSILLSSEYVSCIGGPFGSRHFNGCSQNNRKHSLLFLHASAAWLVQQQWQQQRAKNFNNYARNSRIRFRSSTRRSMK